MQVLQKDPIYRPHRIIGMLIVIVLIVVIAVDSTSSHRLTNVLDAIIIFFVSVQLGRWFQQQHEKDMAAKKVNKQ